MNKKLLYLCLLLATLVIPTSQSAASRPAHAGQPQTTPPGHSVRARIAPRHILVKLEAATDVPAFMRHAKKQGLHKQGRVYGSYWYTLSLPAQANPRAAAARARHLPGVVMATVDPLVRLDQIPPRDPVYRDDDDPTTKDCDPIEEICEDVDFVDQWGLFKIEAENAWNTTTGNSSVVIAVLDSGVDLDHDDLVGNIWVNSGEVPDDGIDNDANGLVDDVHGADFAGNNTVIPPQMIQPHRMVIPIYLWVSGIRKSTYLLLPVIHLWEMVLIMIVTVCRILVFFMALQLQHWQRP